METPVTEQTLYSNDNWHSMEIFNTVTKQTLYSNDNWQIFNTVTEQTLYSNDNCHSMEIFNTVTEQTLYSNDNWHHNTVTKQHSIAIITIAIQSYLI